MTSGAAYDLSPHALMKDRAQTSIILPRRAMGQIIHGKVDRQNGPLSWSVGQYHHLSPRSTRRSRRTTTTTTLIDVCALPPQQAKSRQTQRFIFAAYLMHCKIIIASHPPLFLCQLTPWLFFFFFFNGSFINYSDKISLLCSRTSLFSECPLTKVNLRRNRYNCTWSVLLQNIF